MKSKLALIKRAALLVLLSTLNSQLSTWAQGTAFTYQGRLNSGGNPASGSYDFRFRLAADPAGNNYVGSPVLTNALPVADGLFTVALDFGAVFSGSNYWLEVDVKSNGVAGYTTLLPLQSLTPAPYAEFAAGASNVLGVVPGAGLSGTYGGPVSFNNVGNNFAGDGSALANLNANNLASGTVPSAALNNSWKITGNSGTSPTNGDFVGTTDNQPLELRVNQTRALRLEPGTNIYSVVGAPNVIGGAPNNFVDGGIMGATIAGGGAVNMTGYLPGPSSNHVSAIFGTIGGGRLNTVGADHGFIGGGITNTIQPLAYDSVIAGGSQNTIQGGASESVIAGGFGNTNGGSAGSSIGGGEDNTIQTNASLSTVGGGYHNTIGTNSSYGFIGGGYQNTIKTNGVFSTPFAAIGGGEFNTVSAQNATVGGGYDNTAGGAYATVGGGDFNVASGMSSTVPGGEGNVASGDYSFAAGWTAHATHYGSFVWSDQSSSFVFGSTTSNQFSARAFGGVSFATGGAGMTLDGQPVVTTTALGSLNAANITSGTLADARLSANVALRNAGFNTFAGDLAMSGGTAYHNLSLSGGNSTGYLYGSYPAFGDGIHMGYNYYADANGASHVINPGGGTSRISVGYNSIIMATGGVGVQPNFQNIVVGGTTVTVNGILTVNGTFNNFSDRNAKQDFAPVSSSQILDKVMRLPVSEWSYKVDAATRHIGPMAQDFYSVFNLGTDDRHIAPIDEGGVALASIQALNQKLELDTAAQKQAGEASEAKIQKLEKENEDLRLRLEKLEQRMALTDVAAK